MDVLDNGLLNARVLQFLDGLWSGISLSLVSTFVKFCSIFRHFIHHSKPGVCSSAF
jgi:hypothetical protein